MEGTDYFFFLGHLVQVRMAILLMVIDAENSVAVGKCAFSALCRGFYSF
jgi:hypothetical protein